jgi:hypothetical protein
LLVIDWLERNLLGNLDKSLTIQSNICYTLFSTETIEYGKALKGRVTVLVACRERAVGEKLVCRQAVNKNLELREEIA